MELVLTIDWMSVTEEGSKLGMYDEHGLPRALLTVTKEGTALRLYDESGGEQWISP